MDLASLRYKNLLRSFLRGNEDNGEMPRNCLNCPSPGGHCLATRTSQAEWRLCGRSISVPSVSSCLFAEKLRFSTDKHRRAPLWKSRTSCLRPPVAYCISQALATLSQRVFCGSV